MKNFSNVCLFLFTVLVSTANAQFVSKGWSRSPFEHQVFVENKGQFAGKSLAPNTTLYYSARTAGVDIHFIPGGFVYERENLIEVMDKDSKDENGRPVTYEKVIQRDLHHLQVEWVGSNPSAMVKATELQSFYYTYGSDTKDANATIKANTYKKLTYKNLYPNIDVEFVLPEKGGIKYTIILHPGADLSQVKMQYGNAKSIGADTKGNMVIGSAFGDFTDHAPVSFYANGKAIPSSFVLNGSTVTFKLQGITVNNTQQDIIIDPWTASPGFPTNKAFDVNYDLAGNVYACGSSNPFRLAKFSAAGALLWTYTVPVTFGYYGDFATDEFSGTSYIGEGFSGARVYKVNSNGTQIGFYPGTCASQMNEMWRLEYNRCIKKVVIAGGGTAAGFQAAMLDTTMATVVPVNVMSASQAYHDMSLLAVDNNSNFCYMNRTTNNWNTFNNQLIKCPIPALIPLSFSVNSNHAFIEVGTQTYYTPSPTSNGFNGMACSPSFLYTYDGNNLKKWNKTTGAFIAQTTTGGTMYASGGLTADDCDNVYAGVGTNVKAYNSNLTQIGTYPTTNICYDIKLGQNNKLYAAGLNFVQEILVTATGKTVTTSSTPSAGCSGCSGSATVSITCGNGQLSGYNYSWSPGGQTTQTATGLCAGNYSVTLTTNCSNTFSATVAVTSNGGGGLTLSSGSSGGSCSALGSASVTSSNGTGPYTYSWNPTGQTTQTATGLASGTYTVTVTDNNGCSSTTTVGVTNTGANLGITTGKQDVSCFGLTNGSASATASGGTGTLTYSWNPTGQTTQSATGLAQGTYTITVTDGNGCTGTATVGIVQPAQLVVNTGSTNVSCFGGTNGTVSSTVAGGTGSYTYNWSNSSTTASVSNLGFGTYTLTVTDANGCTATQTATITQPTALVVAAGGIDITCFGAANGSAGVTANGGTSGYGYLWSNSSTQQGITNLIAGTYTVTVTDANNCTATATVLISEPTAVAVNVTGGATCSGQNNGTASATGSGGTSGYNYVWNNGQAAQTATGLSAGTYTVTVTDSKSCTATATVLVTSNPSPVVVFTADDTAGCAVHCVNFTCATANIASYTWDFGDLTTPVITTTNTVNHCYKIPGTFSVTLTVTDQNGCTGTLTKNAYINVFPNVVANFTAAPQPTTVMNPNITFTDLSTGGAIKWDWTFYDDGTTSILQNPKHTYKDSGCYNVRLIADNQYNCPDTASRLVCIGGQYELYAPNAFTPNSNGLNDIWNVKGIGIDPNCFEMYIFDRWGNLIYKTTDLNKGWDGRANGGKDIAQQDVYVWKVFTCDFEGGKHSYIGHVTLVR